MRQPPPPKLTQEIVRAVQPACLFVYLVFVFTVFFCGFYGLGLRVHSVPEIP